MNLPAARLESLQGYLQQDPHNPVLLAEACETAIAAGAAEQAQAHIAVAERLQLDAPAWTFRRARLCIAQRQFAAAVELLQQLRATLGEHPVLAHDLAYVALLQQDPQRCRDLLAPWLQHGDDEHREALQVLWLRATHRLGEVQQGWAWVRQALDTGSLRPAAQGIASLLAIDADDFPAARRLAEQALKCASIPPEALVALATIALADGELPWARRLLQQALQSNPDDGRSWCTLGLAHLRAQELAQAEECLERGLRAMPGHIGSWHALGWARLLQRDLAGAQEAFGQALALDRNFAESQAAVGLVLALQGRATEAERHLELAGRLDRASVTAQYARLVLVGDGKAAAGLAQEVVQQVGLRLRRACPHPSPPPEGEGAKPKIR